MAFDGSNPVSIGDATRAADYDQVFDNTLALQDGTATRDAVDIVTGATTSSLFHMGEASDEGGWFVSTAAGQLVFGAGGEYVSASWIARATSFMGISIAASGIIFYHNTGLTDGVGFSPSAQHSISVTSYDMKTNFLQADEISDPDAPGANDGRIYCRDNGAGKTQLVVRFPTGAVQQIAIEP